MSKGDGSDTSRQQDDDKLTEEKENNNKVKFCYASKQYFVIIFELVVGENVAS
jgi:hypothetical protein